MEPLRPPTTPDVSECEREPIHIIGSVQPHGALLVLSEPTLEVVQASANAASILRFARDQLIGRLAKDLFSESSLAQIKRALSSHHGNDFWPVVACSITTREVPVGLQGLLHRHNGVCVLELEPEANSDVEELTALRQWVSVDFPELFQIATLPDLLQRAAAEFQKMCGFDRVLIYQFDRDWHGAVVAEQRRDFMPSYVNHHFPASDIPPQARDLYTKNLVRLLVDVDAAPSPITPAVNPSTGKPLDLTYSVLRSMSPIHIEYLKNMGVASSMSISLIVRDKLWGLIACHHRTARVVDFATRATCELVAKALSGLVAKMDEHDVTREQLKLGLAQDKILFMLARAENVAESLRNQLPDLISVTNANGVALVGDDVLELYGTTPNKDVVQEVFAWLQDTAKGPVFCSDRLSLDYPQWRQSASQASGLIAIDISSANSLWMLWFRPQQLEEILWAGNPHKPVEIESNHATLHPRKSFELWTEKVGGCSQPWQAIELEAAESMRKHIRDRMLSEILRIGKINEQLRQRREDMLAVFTHDLNVPVVAIDRVLRSLVADESGKVPREIRDTLSVLEAANDKQRERIKKILQVLNYQLARIEIIPEQIDCAELIRRSIAEMALLPEQNAKIFTTINQTDHSFKSDQDSLKRLVVNLVDNAVRAAGAVGCVNISCDCSTTGLSLKVIDNGPGIAPEDQKSIFEKFWQGGEARSYSPHVGMGLVLCKQIVDSLNGTISVDSVPGKGASFTVFLPSL
jgi:light-regulated signal transduction histidine kinase (bacteriophytochrome)